jgi:hypothetical protein
MLAYPFTMDETPELAQVGGKAMSLIALGPTFAGDVWPAETGRGLGGVDGFPLVVTRVPNQGCCLRWKREQSV